MTERSSCSAEERAEIWRSLAEGLARRLREERDAKTRAWGQTSAAHRDHRATLEVLSKAVGINRSGHHPYDRERIKLAILRLRVQLSEQRLAELKPPDF